MLRRLGLEEKVTMGLGTGRGSRLWRWGGLQAQQKVELWVLGLR